MDEELNKGKKTFFTRSKIGILAFALIAAGLLLVFWGFRYEQPVFIKAPLSSYEKVTPAVMVKGEQVKVVRVVDGDTIEIEGGKKVRYIGIDTPETVDPRRPVGCFGHEASEENRRLIEGKTIRLIKDVSETDKFGRLLRYVFIKEGGNEVFVNDYLVRHGFARAATFPPDVAYTTQFVSAEREAKDNQRGLWQKCI